jgi:hypothetical protein
VTEYENVTIITVVPPRGSTIASHVWREYMKSRRSEGQHYLAESIGELRISMQEQYTGPTLVLEASFQDMKGKSVDIAYVMRAYPDWKRNWRKFCSVGLNDCRKTTTC